MALAPNAFCTFCGIILLPKPVAVPVNSFTRHRPWYAEAQAVYTEHEDAGDIQLSGVGFLEMPNLLLAPTDAKCHFADAEKLYPIPLMADGYARWGFGFHRSCWRLLLARLGAQWDEAQVALAIFRQFYCMPCSKHSSLDFGHDYAGAAKPHVVYRSLGGMISSQSYYADPSAVLLDELEMMASPVQKPQDEWADVKTKNGLLGRFPQEILHQIVCYLPYSQVKNVRLASRELARKTAHNVLPMSFWRSQFLLGFDASFLLADTRERRDWARIFQGMELSLSAQEPSLRNRKRICGLIEPIACLVEQDRLYQGHIQADSPIQQLDISLEDLDSVISLSGQLPSTICYGPISEGCRVMHYSLFGLHYHAIEYIAVSTVEFGCETFISGFHLGGPTGTDYFIGFCTGPTTKLRIPTGWTITSCEVAFSARGLVGIQWTYSNGLSCPWIGKKEGKGIARGTLAFPQKRGPKAPVLVVGMDHYKIVRLGVKDPDNGPTTDRNPLAMSITSHLWTPDIPRGKDLIVTTPQPADVQLLCDPLVNIDFGGQGGACLGSLTRIVAHVMTSAFSIMGLDFHYTKEPVRKFGYPGQSEISFFIDGPGGERISEVEVVVGDRFNGMSGLEITTTYGRTAYFSTTRSRRPNANRRIKLHIPPGYQPTGFVAKTQHQEKSSFINFGVQCQPSKTPLAMADRFREGRLYPRSLENKAICDYQTYASFEGVRCITLFVGIEGKPRSPNNIAGLKLEYSAGQPPAAVGQLIQEHEKVALYRGEQVEAMKVWLYHDGKPPTAADLSIRQGRVMAIEMRTTYERCLNFRALGLGSLLDNCTMREFVRNGPDKLMGICWVLNSCYDSVRAVRMSEDRDPLPEDSFPAIDFSTKYLDMVVK